jgi:hypothetical protein
MIYFVPEADYFLLGNPDFSMSGIMYWGIRHGGEFFSGNSHFVIDLLVGGTNSQSKRLGQSNIEFGSVDK